MDSSKQPPASQRLRLSPPQKQTLKKRVKIIDKTRPPQLHVKDVPSDLYDKIKSYVESKNDKWDDGLPIASKHFFFLDGMQATLGKGYILTFETWDYNCPVPGYSDLDLEKFVEPVRGGKIKIVSRSIAK